ncbi:uncharacterized protein LOC133863566 isoform X2 [Alnus glutinosa]|uniref:uncharacterized protein LOC133863566 isoform X2 n=1 Tax=Alnus glutinosa TaxID=3517 RepID=UPI002D79EF74|nr:uncharacterized protein LOC133863566 isoform X2 [Alnus glutinosa]
MAILIKLPYYQRNAILLSPKQAVRSRVASCFHQTTALGQKLHSKCSYFHVGQPSLVNNFKRMTWSIRSNVDSGGFDPSSTNSPNGRTRLIRAIRAIQTKVTGTFYLLPWLCLLLRASGL